MQRSRIIHLMIALFLLCIEIVIAMRFNGGLVRTWLGDVFVVMFLYFLFRGIAPFPRPLHVGIGVLIFAFLIEFSQYFHLIELLGLHDQWMAQLILGDTFQIMDLVAYVIGIALALILDSLKF
ncbi:MAG: DUF2809 domain-containing protein [Bacteroidota bacterium]|nr:DUF2809 domain-containing protein [Bacteroidota bacterium]